MDIQCPGLALKPKPNNEYTASLLGELTFLLSKKHWHDTVNADFPLKSSNEI
jgi:hypothetical protein